MFTNRNRVIYSCILALAFFFSSHVAAQISVLPIEPQRMALATFDVGGEKFRVQTKNPVAIKQLLSLWWGESKDHIPVAKLRWGPSKNYHNSPWNWHMDGESLRMSRFAIELCDGQPSNIERDLFYWIEQVGTFCPWSARLVDLKLMKGR